jgi:DNA gyrase subunit B
MADSELQVPFEPLPKRPITNADRFEFVEGPRGSSEKAGHVHGGTDERALHHCVSEVLDNSVDEFLAGHCTHIDVTIHSDGSISIQDNGRGIPVDINKEENMPGVELVLTRLHSGGKYGQGNYEYSGGTHGVGAKCVNAVSEWFKVEVTREGKDSRHVIRARRNEAEASCHRGSAE